MLEFLKRLFSLNADTSRRKRAGFRLLDVEEEAAKMQLDHRGRKDGARDVPAKEELRLGTVETQIIDVGKNLLQENQHHYEQEFQAYAARLAALTPQGMLSDVRMQTQGLLAEIRDLPQKHALNLSELRGKMAQAQKDLRLFQHDNGLEERPARYPESRILQVSILLAILAAESFLNATLLARGNELGLLGGWTEAILISLINAVAFGYIICRGIRWLICYKAQWKILGIVTLLIGMFFVIAFNLGVAHYRNALGGDSPELAGTVAWGMLQTNTWDIGDVKSMMLLIFGWIVVGIAAFDWLSMDDICPGYGHVTRKYFEARGEHADFHHSLVHGELQGLRDRTNEIISRHLSTAAEVATEDARILERMSILNSRLVESATDIVGGVNRLLQVYRSANKSARESEVPAYFSKDWQYDRQIAPNLLPKPQEMPSIKVYTSVLEPLQQDLSFCYGESLRSLTEMDV